MLRIKKETKRDLNTIRLKEISDVMNFCRKRKRKVKRRFSMMKIVKTKKLKIWITCCRLRIRLRQEPRLTSLRKRNRLMHYFKRIDRKKQRLQKKLLNRSLKESHLNLRLQLESLLTSRWWNPNKPMMTSNIGLQWIRLPRQKNRRKLNCLRVNQMKRKKRNSLSHSQRKKSSGVL